MAHILIIGRTLTSTKEYLTARGHEFTLLQDRNATKYPDRKLKNRVVVDVTNETEMLAIVDAINEQKKIDATFVTYEAYIVTNAMVTKHLGIPGISLESAKACTDKEYMRALFALAPEKISPDFMVAKSEEDLVRFANTHSFPLILKPANLSKSLLVTKNDTLEELVANYRKSLSLIDATYKKYAPGRQAKLLVEEYLDGHIHSVDVFNDKDGIPHVLENVVDYQTGFDIGYSDNFHYSRLLPSRLPENEIEAIRHAAEVGCRALGMTSTPAHVEVIYTKEGPMVVEIGARNGGYRERMHALANGIDITKNALSLALNEPLDIAPKRNDCVGVFELFPRTPGVFMSIANEDTLRALPSFHYMDIKVDPGTFAGKAGDGYKMCAVIILSSSNPEQFEKDMAFLNENVFVQTES